MDNYEYETREARSFHAQLQAVEHAPLQDRREAAAEFGEAMRDDPDTVGERVGWLIEGNYGYGAMQAAKRALASKRMNHVAVLTHMIAALEWQCPQRLAIAAWKKLSAAQKTALQRAITAEITAAQTGE